MLRFRVRSRFKKKALDRIQIKPLDRIVQIPRISGISAESISEQMLHYGMEPVAQRSFDEAAKCYFVALCWLYGSEEQACMVGPRTREGEACQELR